MGLKENVIVGRLIPAGTGGATQQVRHIAARRDQKVIEEARREAEAAAALAAPDEGVFSDPTGASDGDDDSGLVDLPETGGDEQP